MTESDFTFFDPGRLVDHDLQLVLAKTHAGEQKPGWAPYYTFRMMQTDTETHVGDITLRIGDSEHLRKYAGHIGYGVKEPFRGHHYAERAARLLMPLALRHGLETVWITANPDNLPSRRTCERLGAEMVEIVDVPRDTEMYRAGDRQKCRYRLDPAGVIRSSRSPG